MTEICSGRFRAKQVKQLPQAPFREVHLSDKAYKLLLALQKSVDLRKKIKVYIGNFCPKTFILNKRVYLT